MSNTQCTMANVQVNKGSSPGGDSSAVGLTPGT